MQRVQRKRVKGWKMPENTVYVGRPTKWGNPYKVGEMYIPTREIILNPFNPEYEVCTDIDEALSLYKEHISRELEYQRLSLDEIRGKNLACFCSVNQRCHVDVLIELCMAKA